MLINVLIKNPSVKATMHTNKSVIKNEIICNKKLTEGFNKPIVIKFYKRKAHALFIDNIWGADSVDMELISKFNKGCRFLLCVIDIYSKYAWLFL